MSRLEIIGLSLVVALCASGCATRYHKHGLTGGYSEDQIDDTTFLVEFEGNGYTPRSRVEIFLLYRCAELAANAGFDYFAIVARDTDAKNFTYTTPGYYSGTTTGSATAIGNTAFGSAVTHGYYTPGVTVPITRYEASALIKVFKGSKPPEDVNAFDAHSVLLRLSRVVGITREDRGGGGAAHDMAPGVLGGPGDE